MTDYVHCPTCGALCEQVPTSTVGNVHTVTIYPRRAYEELVKGLAGQDDVHPNVYVWQQFVQWAQELIGEAETAECKRSGAQLILVRDVGDQFEQYGAHVREVELRLLVPVDEGIDISALEVKWR